MTLTTLIEENDALHVMLNRSLDVHKQTVAMLRCEPYFSHIAMQIDLGEKIIEELEPLRVGKESK